MNTEPLQEKLEQPEHSPLVEKPACPNEQNQDYRSHTTWIINYNINKLYISELGI